ncbi:60S ribosomal protein L18a-like protein isoform X1 [Impatiens glandulifera]|uniref:60S ribosomal protein L18a-like protein isoform X1 n=2 Tax=Impatiens glandulifera TaxID=253017 RepID=UPI001FB0CDD3|nr:60S ribosomal protein L18a-like protein isoform X1 [Impatiens glandulifera]
MDQKLIMDAKENENGDYTLINDLEKVDDQLGRFDKPLPCCGCGIGWFCFLVGFLCPLTWYFASFLYLFKYYNKDPRERGGLAANTVTALIFTVALIIGFALFMFL